MNDRQAPDAEQATANDKQTVSGVGAVDAQETESKNKKGLTLAEVLPKIFPKKRVVPLNGIEFIVEDLNVDDETVEVLLKARGFTKKGAKQFGRAFEPSKQAQTDPEQLRVELLQMFGEIYDRYAQAFGMMTEQIVAHTVERLEQTVNSAIARFLEPRGFPGQSISPQEIEQAEIEKVRAAVISEGMTALAPERMRELAPHLADKIIARDAKTIQKLLRPQPMKPLDGVETMGVVQNDLIPKSLMPTPFIRRSDESGMFELYWPGYEHALAGFESVNSAVEFWPGAVPDEALAKQLASELSDARAAAVEQLRIELDRRYGSHEIERELWEPITDQLIEVAVFGTRDEMSDERRQEVIEAIGRGQVMHALSEFASIEVKRVIIPVEQMLAEASQKDARADQPARHGSGGAPEWCNHGEAYCVMKYTAPDGRVEILWNSRDGVTPFMIPAAGDDSITLQHGNWHEDAFRPDFVPPVGSRIFIDLTLEKAREYAIAKVEKWWEHPEYSMKGVFASKAEAIESLTNSMFGEQPCEPDIVVVTDEMHAYFESRVGTPELSVESLKNVSAERKLYYDNFISERDKTEAFTMREVSADRLIAETIIEHGIISAQVADELALQILDLLNTEVDPRQPMFEMIVGLATITDEQAHELVELIMTATHPPTLDDLSKRDVARSLDEVNKPLDTTARERLEQAFEDDPDLKSRLEMSGAAGITFSDDKPVDLGEAGELGTASHESARGDEVIDGGSIENLGGIDTAQPSSVEESEPKEVMSNE